MAHKITNQEIKLSLEDIRQTLDNMSHSIMAIQDTIAKDHRLILFQQEKANRPWWKKLLG